MFSSTRFHERLSSVCRARQLSVTKLAKDVLHISSSAPTNWKNGAIPGADVVYACADWLNVSADYLLGLSDSATQPSESDFSEEERQVIDLLRTAPPQARGVAIASMRAVLCAYPPEGDASLSESF